MTLQCTPLTDGNKSPVKIEFKGLAIGDNDRPGDTLGVGFSGFGGHATQPIELTVLT